MSMSVGIQKRDFDIFLSHAHKDRVFVRELDTWLAEKAGFSVWLDTRELAGGSLLATDLQTAIQRCRSILLVASGESLAQGWVKSEYNSAMDERANHDAFRIVALRLPDANVKELMRGTTWIEIPDGRLGLEQAISITHAFYPGEKRPNPRTARDVYVSCSWHTDDNPSARATCRSLAQQGFRLIGDARDQEGFGRGDRVEQIIASCGALVCVIPYRGVDTAIPGQNPYKYFLREVSLASELGLPCLVIADPRVRGENGLDSSWLRMETADMMCSSSVESAISELWENWREPPRPQYIFCAMDLDSEAARSTGPIRHLIERITGMRTMVGSEVSEQPVHAAIMHKICGAFVVLADITDDNLNTCIEAGMALAAGCSLELISRGKSRRPPFMLRGLQMPTYESDIDRVGLIHRIARRYRRRVINAEL